MAELSKEGVLCCRVGSGGAAGGRGAGGDSWRGGSWARPGAWLPRASLPSPSGFAVSRIAGARGLEPAGGRQVAAPCPLPHAPREVLLKPENAEREPWRKEREREGGGPGKGRGVGGARGARKHNRNPGYLNRFILSKPVCQPS